VPAAIAGVLTDLRWRVYQKKPQIPRARHRPPWRCVRSGGGALGRCRRCLRCEGGEARYAALNRFLNEPTGWAAPPNQGAWGWRGLVMFWYKTAVFARRSFRSGGLRSVSNGTMLKEGREGSWADRWVAKRCLPSGTCPEKALPPSASRSRTATIPKQRPTREGTPSPPPACSVLGVHGKKYSATRGP